jgi:hypothetical protein
MLTIACEKKGVSCAQHLHWKYSPRGIDDKRGARFCTHAADADLLNPLCGLCRRSPPKVKKDQQKENQNRVSEWYAAAHQ